MRDCPKCHTKYTDVTLKYCLQDGAELVAAGGHETEVYDPDAFRNDETIAVSPLDTDPQAVSTETEVPARVSIANEGAGKTVERDTVDQRSNVSFVSGFVAGAVILGIAVVVILGFWLFPGMIAGDVNTNTNGAKKESTLISSEEVASINSSSTRKGEKGNLYIPENVMDADVRTAWGEGVKGTGIGEWVKIEFGKKIRLNELVIKPGYFKNASVWQKNNRVASVQLLFSNGRSRIFEFPDEMKTQTIELDGIETTFVKLTIREIYKGSSDQEDTLISEIGFTAVK